MRRRWTAFGSVALLLAVLAGCGIPDETAVRIDGRGPVGDTAPGDPTGGQPPGRTDSGSDQRMFALNFLTAAAGEAAEAYKRVNEYIVSTERFVPKPDDEGDVNLVRVDADGGGIVITQRNDGTSLVKVEVQQVGVLRGNGSIGEPVETEREYTFTIGGAPTDPGMGSGLWVLDPPSVLLMTDRALSTYYQEKTVYFWNSDRTALVPDLRYLPRSVPVQRHATAVLDWLIGGPSDWLSPVAVRLPEGTSPVGNVPAPKDGGRLEVNLSVKAGALETDIELQKLFTQIVWSLKSNQLLDNELELKIQNQSRMIEVAEEYRQRHPLYQLTGAPAGYGVFEGRVYQLANPGDPAPLPIPAEENHDVVTAGATRDGDIVSVALVSRQGEYFRLRTGSGPRVVSALLTSEDRYRSMGRPVWLKGPGERRPAGLVVADGRLMTFTAGNPDLTPVSFSGLSGSVTAVGASVDGNRIAFVADGRLYVAGVRVEDGGLKVEPARQLPTSLHQLSAVDWSGENMLVLAGLDDAGGSAIHRLNVDGALELRQVTNVGAPVEALAAYPEDAQPFPLMYGANQVAFMGETAINRNQVAPGGGTQPSSPNPATAAFYLY
ncbi:LpqB family beta-propeller domain-containing protein [Plantactinospora sp. WMMC1484]|uniref:LpqB family beta-propeller domain-containing protein n=1 Tax=Plantactinospora sp. WMMC1484 TaxID=3404122 RepID=UPI003BF4C5CF